MKKIKQVIKIAVVVLLVAACSKDDGPKNPDPINQPDPNPELGNRPPGTFTLIEVPDKSEDVLPAPEFSWNAATDPDKDTVVYDLYVDKNANPTTIVAEDLTATSFKYMDVMALSLAQDYSWKVVAKDDKGGETNSDIFTFKVKNLDDAQQLTLSKPFAPRSNHASVVFDGKMWVLGGLDQGNDLNDAWSSSDGAEWTFVNELSTQTYPARFFHDAVVFEDKMWIMGGLVNGSFSNDVYTSDDGFDWTKIDQTAAFPERSEHTLTEHNGKIYLIGGGNGGGLLTDVWSTTDGAEWERIDGEASYGERKFHQTVSFKGKLWVIGGQDDAGDKNDVWSSTDGFIWEEETPNAGFSPRGFHKALVFDNKIWVVGGGGLNDIWYSEDGVEWIDATPTISFPVQGSFTALFYDNKIWILGGTPEVWVIDYHFFTN